MSWSWFWHLSIFVFRIEGTNVFLDFQLLPDFSSGMMYLLSLVTPKPSLSRAGRAALASHYELSELGSIHLVSILLT